MATIPRTALQQLGHLPPPDPEAPNQFSLAPEGALAELLEGAGFTDVTVAAIALQRTFASLSEYLADFRDMARRPGRIYEALGPAEREAVDTHIAQAARSFTEPDGSLVLPGSSLVAGAIA